MSKIYRFTGNRKNTEVREKKGDVRDGEVNLTVRFRAAYRLFGRRLKDYKYVVQVGDTDKFAVHRLSEVSQDPDGTEFVGWMWLNKTVEDVK